MNSVYRLKYRSSLLICLLAFAALAMMGCGDDDNGGGGGGGGGNNGGGSTLDSSLRLTELNDSQAMTLCQDLQAIGDCTDTDNNATGTLSAPDECTDFSTNVDKFDPNSCTATVGDATTCQANCQTADAECGRLMECIFSAQQ